VSESNVTVQPDQTPSLPMPPASSPVAAAPTQPQGIQAQVDQWKARFKGLQQQNATLTQQMTQLTDERDQQAVQAATLTTRVDELATTVETNVAAQTEQAALLQTAQSDVMFYTQITSPEYVGLAQFAAVIQRDADPDKWIHSRLH